MTTEATAQEVEQSLESIGDEGKKLLGVMYGITDPRLLGYEDWALPMKLSGGKVCIREINRYNDSTTYYVVEGDRMRAVSVGIDQSETWAEYPTEAVNWLRDAIRSPERLFPVHRSETPFEGREVPTSHA